MKNAMYSCQVLIMHFFLAIPGQRIVTKMKGQKGNSQHYDRNLLDKRVNFDRKSIRTQSRKIGVGPVPWHHKNLTAQKSQQTNAGFINWDRQRHMETK